MKHKHFLNLGLLITLLAASLAAPPAPVAAQSTFDCATVSEIPQAECEALVALYNATGGDNWYYRDGWLQTTTPCSWHGLTCANSHVTQLILSGNHLNGSVPPEIGNLPALTMLNFGVGTRWECGMSDCYPVTSYNTLTTLPPALGNLTNLTSLNLSYNALTTLPPALGNLTNLTSLNLSHNALATLPPAFGDLANLTSLSLFSNNLTTLPPEFGNLINLTSLELSNNNLITLPAPFGNLINLTSLNLNHNVLTSLPLEFGNLTNLTSLSLISNDLTILPPALGNLISLTSLNLSYNALSTLPPAFGNLTNLTSLELNGNDLTTLPPAFGNLTNLASLKLNNNALSTLPPEFGNLTNLTSLELNSNTLSTLPPEFGNLTNLSSLELGLNALTTLPATLGNLVSLTSLNLSYNALTALPSEFGNLINLTSLRLNNNALTALPPTFGNLINLPTLDLSHNALTTLPPAFGNLANLTGLDLWYNNLTELPPEFGNLSGLTTLILTKNALTTLPAQFGNLVNLKNLHVGYNPLQGEIPLFLTHLTQLDNFDFYKTQWCIPITGPVRTWLDNIPHVLGSSLACKYPPGALDLASTPVLYAHIGASFTISITSAYPALPITFTWDNGLVPPITHIGNEIADTAWLYWDTPGEHPLTVTAANKLGTVTTAQSVFVHPVSATTVLPDAPARLVYTDIQGLPTTLNLPAGSVPQTATLLYLPRPQPTSSDPRWQPTARSFTLDLYREGHPLSNLTFSAPASLTLHYHENEVANLDRLTDLQLMRWNPATASWHPAACGPVSHDLEQRSLSLPLCQLGEFALFGPATLTKAVTPTTPVKNGDVLTYTLVFSDPEGSTLRLFDPINPTLQWMGFAGAPPAGVTFGDGAISGTLTLSPTLPLTLSFSVRAQLPENHYAVVSNTAFFCPTNATACILRPSNSVSSAISFPAPVFFPLIFR